MQTRGVRAVWRAATAASLALLFALPLAGRTSQAQPVSESDPEIEILSVAHDPAGTISVGLRAEGARHVQISQLTAFVNDIPTSVDVTASAVADDLALMLTIDASGSMAGIPFTAARQASRELVSRLALEDRVGVISFNDSAAVRIALTADHGAVVEVINRLVPQGSTALYDAVALSVEALSQATEKRRVIVLLSDGHEFGGLSRTDRDTTTARARDAGVIIYTVGLGTDYDREYLETLADSTAGEFFAVHTADDVEALSALFTRLGGALGSVETYTIPVRPLPLGTHRLSLRGVVNDSPVTVSTTFNVSNETLIRPWVAPPSPDGTSVEVHFDPLIPPQHLVIETRVAGRVFIPASPSTGTVLIDFWRLAPGSHEVELLAFIGGRPGARAEVTIDVPVLEPLLTVTERDGALVARGWVQQWESPTIVLLLDGVEAGRSRAEMVVSPGAEPITFQLLDEQSRTVAVHEVPGNAVPLAADTATPSPRSLLLLVPVAALTAGGGWWFSRRRRRPEGKTKASIRRRSRPATTREPVSLTEHRALGEMQPGPGVTPQDEMFGRIIARDAAGRVQDVILARRPLTVGRAPGCDIVLDDAEVHPMHARIMVLSPSEVQVHAFPDTGLRPYDHAEEDEWLIVHHGEHLLLGSSSLEVLLNERVRASDDDGPASWARAGA